MIITEFYKTRKDGVNLVHIYSDQGVQIRQIDTGILYEDVIDPESNPLNHSYEETNIPIEEQELTSEEALEILLGGTEQ